MNRRDLIKTALVTTILPFLPGKVLAKYIAIGNGKDVKLYCSVDAVENGRTHFSVINGQWEGSIKDGVVFVKCTRDRFPATILWAGTPPNSVVNDYNKAINWIRNQL